MAKLEQWSLEKYATPEDPFGMNTHRRLEGVDPKTGVKTSTDSYPIGDLYYDGYTSARRKDTTKTGYKREIYKAVGNKYYGMMGLKFENPDPYDRITIYTPGSYIIGDSLELTTRPRIRTSEYNRLTDEIDRSWGGRGAPEVKPEDIEVSIGTALDINRLVHLREYRFKAVYGYTLQGTELDAPLRIVEFGIRPTTMEVDGKRFTIDSGGPVNFLEVDNYMASRDIEQNLDEAKRLLEVVSETDTEVDSDLTNNYRLDEKGLDGQIDLTCAVDEISKRRVKRTVAATGKALQTVVGTDLTRAQLAALGKWIGLQLSRNNHNLRYSVTDPESLIQAANRHLGSAIADHYRMEQSGQAMTIRFEQDDKNLWNVSASEGTGMRDVTDKRGFEDLGQEMLDFYLSHKGVSFDVSQVDHLPKIVDPTERILQAIFGDAEEAKQPSIRGDFLQFKVEGLPRPTRSLTYTVPLHVSNARFHELGATPSLVGWQRAISRFPYRYISEGL